VTFDHHGGIGADSIHVSQATRVLFGHLVPRPLGGEHLAFPEVIHAHATALPGIDVAERGQALAGHHGRVSSALEYVGADVRDVVRDACAQLEAPTGRGKVKLAWAPDVRGVVLRVRKREVRTTYLAGYSGLALWQLTARAHVVNGPVRKVIARPAYRQADGTDYVAVGHEPWAERSKSARQVRKSQTKRKRAEIDVKRGLPLSVAAAEIAETMDVGSSVTVRDTDRGTSVRISRSAVRWNVTYTDRTGVKHVARNVRRPALVMRAVERFSA
jgi:hypothetical protein